MGLDEAALASAAAAVAATQAGGGAGEGGDAASPSADEDGKKGKGKAGAAAGAKRKRAAKLAEEVVVGESWHFNLRARPRHPAPVHQPSLPRSWLLEADLGAARATGTKPC